MSVPPLQSREVAWRGWKAIEQTNGLFTLRHVPAIGGRTMSVEIGGDDAILVFPSEQGKSYSPAERYKSVHFGGHYTCIGPELVWNVNEQPFSPHSGEYRYELDTSSPDRHVLHLISRPGTWLDATIQIERDITTFRGNTHVIVDERIFNRGREPLRFYSWDFTQINALRPRGGGLRDLTIYVPVPDRDGRKEYKQFVTLPPEASVQFDENVGPGILGIDNHGFLFKIASHAAAWWLACVDHQTGWTYIKAFDVDPAAQYVDDNGPIEVFGSAYDRDKPEAFLEMELLGGIRSVPPGVPITTREHWYATICRGPVLAMTDVGLVAEPLRCARKGDVVEAKGRFGVFYAGYVQVELFDADALPAGASERIAITPTQTLALHASVHPEAGAVRATLFVLDHQGRRVGVLDSVPIR